MKYVYYCSNKYRRKTNLRCGLPWFLSTAAVFYVVLQLSQTSTNEDTNVRSPLDPVEPPLSSNELLSKTSDVSINQTVGMFGECLNYTAPVITHTSTAKQHIVFVKVHKAASTTVQSILMRYALANKLNVMSRFRSFHIDEYNSDIPVEDLVPSCTGFKYDILCNHLIFNKTKIAPYFPKDSVYIGIVREPFQQFLSAFIYYSTFKSKVWVQNVVAEYPQDPIEEFFRDSKRHIKHFSPNFTFWDNRMSVDFGFPLKNFHILKDNSTFVQQFLDNLNTTFDLVMVAEYFDDSLVLMRRLLGWTTKDIIYLSRNVLKLKHGDSAWKRKRTHPSYIMNRFQSHQNLDIALYDFFLKVFKDKLKSQPPDFDREVLEFKNISKEVTQLCLESGTISSVLPHFFPATQVVSEFTLTEEDCGNMNSTETVTYYKAANQYNQQFGGLNAEFAARVKFVSEWSIKHNVSKSLQNPSNF